MSFDIIVFLITFQNIVHCSSFELCICNTSSFFIITLKYYNEFITRIQHLFMHCWLSCLFPNDDVLYLICKISKQFKHRRFGTCYNLIIPQHTFGYSQQFCQNIFMKIIILFYCKIIRKVFIFF